jgi:hypothetical protein
MPGPVESAIRATLQQGQALATLGRGASASVGPMDGDGITLLMGHRKARTPVKWSTLEAIPLFLVGRDWVQLTGAYDPSENAGTLASFLADRQCKATAALVGAMLEAAGVVESDSGGKQVRISRAMSPARSSRPATSGDAAIEQPFRRMQERPVRLDPHRH